MIFFPAHVETTKGHGRIETRTIQTADVLNDYLTFPHVAQVFRVKRHVTDLQGANPREEIVYGLTSRASDKASSQDLLSFNRGHWEIENGVHYVRDVTFDEDRCRIRTGHGAHVMASLRNLSMSVLRLAGCKTIASGTRALGYHDKKKCLRLLGLTDP